MECPVCLKKEKHKLHINPCKHELCSDCFKKIILKKCPICRGEMVSLYDARLLSPKYIMVKTTKKDKIISLNKLKRHVFSTEFKNYLTDVLTKPHQYVIKRTIFCIELPNKMRVYSPENLGLYTITELFFMYESNIHRYFQFNPNITNNLIMKIKEEIQSRLIYPNLNSQYNI